MDHELRQSGLKFCEGLGARNVLMGSGWSHKTGKCGRPATAQGPFRAHPTRRGHGTTTAGPQLAGRLARVCTHLGLGFLPRPRVVQAIDALPPCPPPACPLLSVASQPSRPPATRLGRSVPPTRVLPGCRALRGALGGVPVWGGRRGGDSGGHRPPAEPGPRRLTRGLQSPGGGGRHGGPLGSSGRDGWAAAPGARGSRDVTHPDSEPGLPSRAD